MPRKLAKPPSPLNNLNYGEKLAEQLLKFSKQMELAYKRLAELEKKDSTTDAELNKFLKYVAKKKPWFQQAQAHVFAVWRTCITKLDMCADEHYTGRSKRPAVWIESKEEKGRSKSKRQRCCCKACRKKRLLDGDVAEDALHMTFYLGTVAF